MYSFHGNIPVWGEHDEATLNQIKRCAQDEVVAGAALMADGHKGYSMPIGGVVAYRNAISPSGVGYDISCGNKAVRTNLRADDIQPEIEKIMDEIAKTVVFGVGQGNNGKARDHELFDDPAWKDLPFLRPLRQLAQEQLGSVGSGNHYVDLFRDEKGWVWIGVHFGSRGFGHRTASGFLNLAAGRAFDDKAPGEHIGPAADRLFACDRSGPSLLAGHDARGALRLRGARLRCRAGAPDLGRQDHRFGSQPPQLRLARKAQRRRADCGAQRCHARLAGPALLHRRLNGRHQCDHRGRRERGSQAGPA